MDIKSRLTSSLKDKKMRRRAIVVIILVWLIVVGLHHTNKDLPAGLSYEGEVHEVSAEAVQVFTDRTFIDDEGVYRSEQEIFDEIMRMIDESVEYVLIDMFLFNDFLGTATSSYRDLSGELVQTLIDKKTANPEMVIQVITDQINVIYGGIESEQLNQLEAAGVEVVLTDLTALRDSNALYSSLWRTFGQWWGNSTRPGYLPNPFSATGQKLGARTYFRLLNFKANHRKVIVTDYQDGDEYGLLTLITSANPHDGSSRHSNFAIRVDEELWADVIKSEQAVMAFSDGDFMTPSREVTADSGADEGSKLAVQLLTEQAIQDAIITNIDALGAGDTLDIAMFYLADREIIEAFKRADTRGVQIRLLLDPNKDAFGREKGGLPNRQVAHELISASNGSTEIRWCATHGEQCHSKLVFMKSGDTATLIQGSANLTRRNLDDFNLETNVLISGDQNASVFADTESFFAAQWNNEKDRLYSHDYAQYADDSSVKTLRYRFMEWSGLSSW